MAPKEKSMIDAANAENDSEQDEPLLLRKESDAKTDQGESVEGPPVRTLNLLRVIYFFNGLSASTWGRFGIIYYNQVKHLTPPQIGLLSGAIPIISFVTQPLWGAVADSIHSRKVVYLGCKFLSTCALLVLSLPFIDSFGKIFACVAGTAVFTAGGVLDAHTMDFLGDAHRGLYGTIRVWTAISWGMGAVIMGYITDLFGFQVNFWLYGTMSFGMLLFVAFGLSARSSTEQANYDNPITRRPRTEHLREALCKLPVLFWLIEVALVGAAMSLVDNFLFVYLQNDLHATTVLCGWTVGVTVLFELPIFWCSKFLLQRVGHDGLFLISLSAYSTRVFGYTMLRPSTVHWVLPLEVFHGVTFACALVASVDYSAAVAPKEWSTTVQSILTTVMSCVGGGIGSILGGILVREYGFVFLYEGAGYVTGLVAIFNLGLWFCGRGHNAFLDRLATDAEHKKEIQGLQLVGIDTEQGTL